MSSSSASSAITALSPGGVLMQAGPQQTISRELNIHTFPCYRTLTTQLLLHCPLQYFITLWCISASSQVQDPFLFWYSNGYLICPLFKILWLGPMIDLKCEKNMKKHDENDMAKCLWTHDTVMCNLCNLFQTYSSFIL